MAASPQRRGTNNGIAAAGPKAGGAVEHESLADLDVRLHDAERTYRDAQRDIPEDRSSLRDAEYKFQQWRDDHQASETRRSQAGAKDDRAQRDARDAQRRLRETRRPPPSSANQDAGAQERNRVRRLQGEQPQ